VIEHRDEPVDELARTLLASVRAFARGAAQQDDITAVLVKREPAGAHASFRRSIDALDEIVAFTGAFFASEGIDAASKPAVDFAVEELFTNMVKYGASREPIRIDLAPIAGGVEVALTDYDVEPFDVTSSPDVDVGAPIEKRAIGGLGLHLIRRMVDSIEYDYSKEQRRSRVVFRKTRAGDAAGAGGAS
jgi:anti-sigma regulatory factor (Ser/Thr protein kinase)